MKRSLLLSFCVLAFSIAASGCGDPGQRAKEAQQLFKVQEPIALPEGSRPNDIKLVDVNGDGKDDLVLACSGKAAICVMLGDGKGKFTASPGSPFSAGTSPHLVATGDFNSDKKVDLAVTSHDSNGVFILLGDGRGGFTLTLASPFIGFPLGKPHNHGLVVADVNGDGNPDITMGHQDHGAIAVLLGDGKERFTPAPGSPFDLGRGFYPHALGDVNGDGKLDVVAPDIMGAAIVVGLGDGKGTFKAGSSYRVKQRPFYIQLEDLNGDKKLDIASTHDDIQDVDVLIGDGQGGFAPAAGSPFDSGLQGWKIKSADFDRDGLNDLVIGGGRSFVVLFGDGAGRFVARPESNQASGAAFGMAVGDVNKDGKPDVVLADAEKGTVTIYLHK